MQKNTSLWLKFLGVQKRTPNSEQWISAIGGFLSILAIFSISFRTTNLQGASAILPSMGAATVLLFAVPKAPLSQPWALFAGNLLSAMIGVVCYRWIDDIFFAAGLAVGLSILVMLACRCTHPPGGATALAAVIGGDAIHQLGFYYVLIPTLINCLVIFFVALIFNNLFGWRRYPALKTITAIKSSHSITNVSEQHIQQALKTLAHPEHVPLTVKKLKTLFDHALILSNSVNKQNLALEVGAYYSNGHPCLGWSLRQITDIINHPNAQHRMVAYRIVEGRYKWRTDSCQLNEFANWAKARIDFQS